MDGAEGNGRKRQQRHPGVAAAVLGSLGVVFGDIGTSPLYTLQECFHSRGWAADAETVMGVTSLIFWALFLVVTVKYVCVLMQADNHGEGGIVALLALVPAEKREVVAGRVGWISLLVIAGASLLYGDGIITPAISVLSAIEGLETADAALSRFVLPITVAILIALFAVQRKGSGGLGKVFGPVMVVWFAIIGYLGVRSIVQTPGVLGAMLPTHALGFFLHHRRHGLAMLGSVVMAVTGGEALYADMGHFGRGPIRISWFSCVLPALLLNYFGQAALLLRQPEAVAHPFFSMVTSSGVRIALTVLAAMATIIASQGVITAVMSLTHQAIRLGYLPHMTVLHTSEEVEGQIYLPLVNGALAAACLTLVLIFRESSRLAAAYGLAVSGTMAITSIVFYSATQHHWGWPRWKSALLLVFFLSFDLPFLAGSCTKLFEGGYIPLGVGVVMFALMHTWASGRSCLWAALDERSETPDHMMREMEDPSLPRAFPLGVCITASGHGVPVVLGEVFARFRTLPEEIVLLSVRSASVPYLEVEEQFDIEKLAPNLFRLKCEVGFMEAFDAPAALRAAAPQMKLKCSPDEAVYLVGKASYCRAETPRNWWRWHYLFFIFLSNNALDLTQSFNLPPDNVIELGVRVPL